MTYVETIPPERVTGLAAEQYAQDMADQGYVANYTQLFSLRPEVLAAWAQLIESIRSNMDRRRYELVTVAAAAALNTRACMVAHGAVLRRRFYSSDELVAIAGDYRTAGLPPAEVAMMAFAEKVARAADQVTRADVDVLRGHGLSDAEIFDVALAAAARSFFGKALDAMGVEPDVAHQEVLGQELMTKLSFGRTPGAGSAQPPT